MYVKEVTVENQVGLHARPATFFIQKANEYKSSIWVEKEGNISHMNKCTVKNNDGIYKSCADVMRTLCFYHAKSHHLDRADFLVLYSTCK